MCRQNILVPLLLSNYVCDTTNNTAAVMGLFKTKIAVMRDLSKTKIYDKRGSIHSSTSLLSAMTSSTLSNGDDDDDSLAAMQRAAERADGLLKKPVKNKKMMDRAMMILIPWQVCRGLPIERADGLLKKPAKNKKMMDRVYPYPKRLDEGAP